MIKVLNNIIITILILSFNIVCNAKEEVLFTINNNPTTTIDLDNRVYYLSIFNKFDINTINKNNYIDELISVSIFNEFAKSKNYKIKISEINEYYAIIYKNNKQIIDNLINNNFLKKEVIFKNIKFDLQRKKTIESLIKNKINNISTSINNNNILDIYNILIDYFIVDNQFKNKFDNNFKEISSNNISIK